MFPVCLSFPAHRRFSPALLILALLFLASITVVGAQTPTPAGQQPPQPDQATPDSGGPTGDTGVMAIPKKKENQDNTPPPAPAAPKIKNPEGMPNFSLRVEVPEVSVDVGVLLEKTGQFVPNLKPGNFRVYEDGVEQKVAGFKRTEAPITALMLCEFAANGYWWIKGQDMLNAAYAFANQLRPNDYVALMTYDMHTQIVTDFTQDKHQIQEAIGTMRMPWTPLSTSAMSCTTARSVPVELPAMIVTTFSFMRER